MMCSDDHNEFFRDGLVTMPMIEGSAMAQVVASEIRRRPHSVGCDAIDQLRTEPSLDNLRKLLMLEDTLSRAMQTTVRELRLHGTTWEAIGMLLGTTRQAAQQRFGR